MTELNSFKLLIAVSAHRELVAFGSRNQGNGMNFRIIENLFFFFLKNFVLKYIIENLKSKSYGS